MQNKISYGARWSGRNKVYSATLLEKSTVKEVLQALCRKMNYPTKQIEELIIRGSSRPQDKYELNQQAPEKDILVIFKKQ